jgi:hemin uptake protein HemP
MDTTCLLPPRNATAFYMTSEPDDTADETPSEPVKPTKDDLPPLVIPSEDLFKGRQIIWLEHDGARYCLRITRKNKLILHK